MWVLLSETGFKLDLISFQKDIKIPSIITHVILDFEIYTLSGVIQANHNNPSVYRKLPCGICSL